MVSFPKFAAKTVEWIQTADYIDERFLINESRSRVAEGASRSASVVGRKAGSWTKRPVPDAIKLTPEVGRLMGLFLAEGHTSGQTLFWSYGIHERDTFVDETVRLLKGCFGVDASVKIRTNNVAQVVVHGSKWANLFENLFRRGAGRKRLCAELLSGPVDFLRAVLYGWLDGDRKRGTSACSISREMALNMFDIANALGMLPRFEYYPEKVDKNGVHHCKAYVVHWRENQEKQIVDSRWNSKQTESEMWRAVKSVSSEPFEGWVFNLEVEDDHTYIAEGIAVHNCWAYSTTQAVEVMRMIQNHPYVMLSPESLGPSVSWRNAGNSLDSSLQQVRDFGVCPVTCMDKEYSRSPSRWKAGWEKQALLHRVTGWYDVGNFDELMTLLMLRVPVVVGLAWWSHAIIYFDPVEISTGKYGVKFRNSWGASWPSAGADGWSILTESKATPSLGAFAPIAVTGSET